MIGVELVAIGADAPYKYKEFKPTQFETMGPAWIVKTLTAHCELPKWRVCGTVFTHDGGMGVIYERAP